MNQIAEAKVEFIYWIAHATNNKILESHKVLFILD